MRAEDDEDIVDNEEKDTTIDESFSPTAQSTPHQSSTSLLKVVPISLEPTPGHYANLGNSRTGMAPSKPQRHVAEERSMSGGMDNSISGGVGMFHAKTSSITGSIHSETMSDSTISFPSSSSARKMMDGSEADSERDSVSPQRGLPDSEVCRAMACFEITEWKTNLNSIFQAKVNPEN